MKIKKSIFNQLRNTQGFTLVEVLVALSLLTVGVLGVAGMQLMSVSGNTFGRELQMAILVGQDLLETMQTMDSTSIDLSPGYHGAEEESDNGFQDSIPHTVIPDPNSPGFIFTREWNVSPGPFNKTQEITVTILWTKKGASGKEGEEDKKNKINLYTTRLE